MKKVFLLSISLACFALTFFSCSDEKEAANGNLQVKYADATEVKFYENAEVYLYLSEAERSADLTLTNYFAKGLTDSLIPKDKGAVFSNLEERTYYIFCRYKDPSSGNWNSGTGTSGVPKGATTDVTVHMYPNGNLQVKFCDLSQTQYFGEAEVYLYSSDTARSNDTLRSRYLQKRLTDATNPTQYGAVFIALDPKTYYVYCRWEHPTQHVWYTGKGQSICPKNATTTLVVKKD